MRVRRLKNELRSRWGDYLNARTQQHQAEVALNQAVGRPFIGLSESTDREFLNFLNFYTRAPQLPPAKLQAIVEQLQRLERALSYRYRTEVKANKYKIRVPFGADKVAKQDAKIGNNDYDWEIPNKRTIRATKTKLSLARIALRFIWEECAQ